MVVQILPLLARVEAHHRGSAGAASLKDMRLDRVCVARPARRTAASDCVLEQPDVKSIHIQSRCELVAVPSRPSRRFLRQGFAQPVSGPLRITVKMKLPESVTGGAFSCLTGNVKKSQFKTKLEEVAAF